MNVLHAEFILKVKKNQVAVFVALCIHVAKCHKVVYLIRYCINRTTLNILSVRS